MGKRITNYVKIKMPVCATSIYRSRIRPMTGSDDKVLIYCNVPIAATSKSTGF